MPVKTLYIDQIILSDMRPKGARLPRPTPGMVALAKTLQTVQPILVRPVKLAKRDEYEIVAGEVSWFTAQAAGIQTIDCQIIEASDDAVSRSLAIECNTLNSNPIEYAKSISNVINNQKKKNIAAVARQLGLSRSALHHKLRLLQLHKEVQALVESGKLSPLHVRTLTPLSAVEQVALAKAMQDASLSGLNANRFVSYYKKIFLEAFPASPPPEESIHAAIDRALSMLQQKEASDTLNVEPSPIPSAATSPKTPGDLAALLETFRVGRSRAGSHSNVDMDRLERDLTAIVGYRCVIQELPTGIGEISFHYSDEGSREYLQDTLLGKLNDDTSLHSVSNGNQGWFCLIYQDSQESSNFVEALFGSASIDDDSVFW